MFFRNYTYLHLSHFAFENKIPMIVFRVYTHRSGLKPSLLTFYILVLHTKRIKAKIGERRLKGSLSPPYWRGSLCIPPLITKKGQRSLASMPQETLFSNL